MFLSRIIKHTLSSVAAVSMCMGLVQIARAQQVPDSLNVASSIKTADPVVEAKYLGKTNSRRKLAPEDAKRRAIALAITEGNEARREGKFQLAVAAYERAVTLDAKDPRGRYGLGNVFANLTCTDSAIAEYRAALHLKNDFRDALIGLGYTLANKQRFDEAESQFQQLLKVKKDDPAGLIGLAFVLWKRKKYDEAINGFIKIGTTESINSDDRAVAYLFLGDIHKERDKWDNAREAYKKAVTLNSGATTNFVSVEAYLGLGQTELLPAMERFGNFAPDERRTEDREQVISAAREAAEHFRRAIYEFKYNHPTGYLFLAIALEYQLLFRDAENTFSSYLKKVQELEDQLPTLAKTKTCDYGFATLRARYYHFQAMSFQQERFLTSDYQKVAELDRKTIECLEHMIRLNADDAGGYSILAGVYYMQQKYAAAIEQFDNALSREKNEKNKARHYSGRGMSYSHMQRPKDAIDDLNRAIKIAPEVATTYWHLALVYDHQGNLDEAISVAERAMAREQPLKAHSHFFLASFYFRKARKSRNDADYEQAIKLANQAISVQPSYASPYLLLGNVYKHYKGGARVDEAIVNYELAAKYDPHNPSIPFGLGDVYYSIKNNDNAAIQNLTQALKLKPDFTAAYWMLGKAYLSKGNYAEAVKQFENAIKSDPKYVDAYLDLADVYAQQKNYEDAIKWLLKATEEVPTDYLPYKEAARIYSHHQKNDEAIRHYEKAIALVDRDLAWFGEVMKCRVLRLRRQYPEAISCLESVKMPGSADPAQIPYDLGLTYAASGNKQAAQARYDELIRLKSSLAEDLLRQINEMK